MMMSRGTSHPPSPHFSLNRRGRSPIQKKTRATGGKQSKWWHAPPSTDPRPSPAFPFLSSHVRSRREQVLHRRPGKAHLNAHKTTERKTRLSKERAIGKAQLNLIKGCLPYKKASIRG